MPVHNADIAAMFAEVGDLIGIQGANPFRVRAYRNAARSLEGLGREVRTMVEKGEDLTDLPGIGDDLAAKIVEIVGTGRCAFLDRLHRELPAAITELLKIPGIGPKRVKALYHDLDLLATAAEDSPVSDRFAGYDEVAEVLASGPTRSAVRLKSGLQVDLRVVPDESFGAALHYFTGSKAHNIAIRKLGQARGLKINEYDVFRGATRIAGETEESVFAAVDLPWIPPELREDHGEIEAAAQAAGLEYLAITEHSRRLTMAHGLDPVRLAKQGGEIDRLNDELSGITLRKGIEVDVLEDGTLDLADSALADLDVVVAAIHSRFELSRAKQTERLLTAIAHPRVNILAHPLGRLIGQREPYDVDMLRVIRAAKKARVHLELNAHPERLDLLDAYCRMAKEEGVLVAVSSDAHGTHDFANLRFGIGQARRGWLEREDVLNSRGWSALKPLLARGVTQPRL